MFVAAKGYLPLPGELRFDMFDAEYTHESDQCTFEVLCRRFGLEVKGLRAIAELVHDLDLEDQKFTRAEAPGLGAQLTGLTLVHEDDASSTAAPSSTSYSSTLPGRTADSIRGAS
jgi:hypothetical protein